jgi:hypothetical protein
MTATNETRSASKTSTILRNQAAIESFAVALDVNDDHLGGQQLDDRPRTRRLRKTEQRFHAGQSSATFKPRNHRLGRPYTLGEFRLRETGPDPSRDQLAGQTEFIRHRIVSGANLLISEHLLFH